MVADAYNSVIQEADGLLQVQSYPDLHGISASQNYRGRPCQKTDRQTDR